MITPGAYIVHIAGLECDMWVDVYKEPLLSQEAENLIDDAETSLPIERICVTEENNEIFLVVHHGKCGLFASYMKMTPKKHAFAE